MHRTLYIPEILLNIFGHCAPPGASRFTIREHRYTADLVALARTCKFFKELALDILWEELDQVSLLACCLPDACHRNIDGPWCYSFTRPLTEADWNTLQGYARRVWHISDRWDEMMPLDSSAMNLIFSQTPFTGSLFPRLRSIRWGNFMTFPVAHAAVPSLVSIHLDLLRFPRDPPPPTRVFDALGESCSDIRRFRLDNYYCGSLDVVVSSLLCRWKNLQCVDCFEVTLSVDALLHLCSAAGTLTQLSFALSADFDDHISHFDILYIFSKLAVLKTKSRRLKTITNFISRICLPVIKELGAISSAFTPRRDIQKYWTTAQKACTSNILTYLSLSCSGGGTEELIHLNEWLTLDDLLPYRDFGNLRKMHVNIPWSAKLTDTDILDLVSTSPQLEELAINKDWGWKMGDDEGGITPSGLMELLRQCPSLSTMILVINTWAFAEMPDELDISFEPREEFYFDFLDSFISSALVPSLVSAFVDLELGLCNFTGGRGLPSREVQAAFCELWRRVDFQVMEYL